MRTLGAALLGIANGYNQYQDATQDRQYQLATRAMNLHNMDTTSQINDIALQTAQYKLQEDQAEARAYMGAVAPQPTPQMPKPQGPAPQAAPPQGPPDLSGLLAGADPNYDDSKATPVAPQGPPLAMPPGINTAGGWGSMAAQGRAQQPTRDAIAATMPQEELAQMLTAAVDPNLTPEQRQAAQNAVAALKKEITVRKLNVDSQQAQATTQAATTAIDAPADAADKTVAVAEATGGPTPTAPAADQYAQKAAALDAAALRAQNDPQASPAVRARVALNLATKAQAAREQSLKYQKETLANNQEKLKAMAGAMGALDEEPTQTNYNDVLLLHKNDAAFQEQFAAMHLTGDINADRQKIHTLAMSGMTSNQMQDHALRASEQEIKRRSNDLREEQLKVREAQMKVVKAMPKVDDMGMPLEGTALLAKLDPETAMNVKGIATGQLKLENISTKGGERATMAGLVMRYNPGYQQSDYATAASTEKDFANGLEARSVRSFNVGLAHLDTLQKYADALKNGAESPQLFSKLKNDFEAATGRPAPTNYDAVAPIVADEVVKAIVGSKNALADREEIKASVDRKMSGMQLNGAIAAYKELFGGQLRGLATQWASGTKKSEAEFFKKYVPSLPNGPEGTVFAAPGGTETPATPQAPAASGKASTVDIGNGFKLHL